MLVPRFWTDDEIALLLREWRTKSASQIAGMLRHKRTRNSVIGKLHRLRALDVIKPLQHAKQFDVEPDRSPKQPRKLRPGPKPASTTPKSAPQPHRRMTVKDLLNESLSPLRMRPCTLLELTEQSCRWPLDLGPQRSTHFCGAPRLGIGPIEAGEPYCPHHALVAVGRGQS